ncbi:hypothetical protein [Brucella sp. NBRC 12950]|uniref:hypothetical protein n=1 Tax=Brucella sp. NBRC 12950 TaxID=2994518 RepID=UPI0033240D65
MPPRVWWSVRLTRKNNTIFNSNPLFTAQKNDLARHATRIVAGQRTAFIDSCQKNLSVIEALPIDCSLTIITNAPSIAIALESRHRCQIVMSGGNFDRRQGAVLRSPAPSTFRHYIPICSPWAHVAWIPKSGLQRRMPKNHVRKSPH